MPDSKNPTAPEITVYVTNHNYGRFVDQAVQSVLEQSYQDFELIIIDDGSKDNSREILEKYIGHDKIQVIFQEAKGLNTTNNIALNMARGRYVMRLDADDFLDPNALLVLHNTLQGNPQIALAFPDYFLVDEVGQILGVEKRLDFGRADVILDRPAHGACTMFRRDVMNRVGGYSQDYNCQDGVDIWLGIVAHHPVVNVPSPLFYYRQHGSNLTGNKLRILETRQRIFHDHALRREEDASALVVIPVRGREIAPDDQSLREIDGIAVVDRLIQSAQAAQNVRQIAVTSSDPAVRDYVTGRYRSEDVAFILRDRALALKNVRLDLSLKHVLDTLGEHDAAPRSIIALSTEFPFISPGCIDSVADCFALFSPERVISTTRVSESVYQHDGSSLISVGNNDKFMRLEREQMFLHRGGVIAYDRAAFQQDAFADRPPVTSFVEIDEISAHSIHTELGSAMSEYISILAKGRSAVSTKPTVRASI
jgi:glycosyltransferase involved in cell wall biosynthesis